MTIMESCLKLKILSLLINCPLPLEILVKEKPGDWTKKEFLDFLKDMYIDDIIGITNKKEIYLK